MSFLFAGIILTGNDFSSLFFGILVTYYAGRKNKPRWIAVGSLMVSAFSVINILPHIIYGSGSEALALTKEYEKIHANSSRNATTDLCSRDGVGCIREGSLEPQVIFFVSQFLLGIGSPLYTNLGMAYMDDNIKRSKTPILISKLLCWRRVGEDSTYRYLLSFFR